MSEPWTLAQLGSQLAEVERERDEARADLATLRSEVEDRAVDLLAARAEIATLRARLGSQDSPPNSGAGPRKEPT